MTKPANNPPTDQTPTTPGKALLVTRLLIVIGLCVGIGVFTVLTVIQYKNGPSNQTRPTSFGASTTSPDQQPATPTGTSPMAGLNGLDTSKFPPITRPNPHPGQIAPFLRADPHNYPYYQKVDNGEVWEYCDYKVLDASLTDLIAHYDKQAKLAGMKLIKQKPTSNNMPGGIDASWSDGRRGLNVTAWPLPNTKPAAPPLRPSTPLQWVVRYSYPTLAR